MRGDVKWIKESVAERCAELWRAVLPQEEMRPDELN
jgi:hypothetical protein